jgi:hypothetical protein
MTSLLVMRGLLMEKACDRTSCDGSPDIGQQKAIDNPPAKDAARQGLVENPRTDDVQKQAYLELMFRALMDIEFLLNAYADAGERKQYKKLLGQVRCATGRTRTLVGEKLDLLMRTLEHRRKCAEALERSAAGEADKLQSAHEQWVRRMIGVRSALDLTGLDDACFSIFGNSAHISLETADHSELTSRMPVLRKALAAILTRNDSVRVTCSTWEKLAPSTFELAL